MQQPHAGCQKAYAPSKPTRCGRFNLYQNPLKGQYFFDFSTAAGLKAAPLIEKET